MSKAEIRDIAKGVEVPLDTYKPFEDYKADLEMADAATKLLRAEGGDEYLPAGHTMIVPAGSEMVGGLGKLPAGHDPRDVRLIPDNVVQPNHYARYPIEPITFINANNLPFNIGNVIKYVLRYDAKNGLEDLRKAKRYIDIQIECLERAARVEKGESPQDVWKAKL